MDDQFDFFNEQLEFTADIIQCDKHGRTEGTVVGFHSGDDHTGCIVVDRICVMCLGGYLRPILQQFQKPRVGTTYEKGNVVEH